MKFHPKNSISVRLDNNATGQLSTDIYHNISETFFKLQITFKIVNPDNSDMWTPYLLIIDAMHNENNLCDSKKNFQ